MVALCADSVEQNLHLAEQQNFDFPILSDAHLVTTDAYGLRHKLGNPMEGRDISRPAIFLIDPQGVIQWRYLTDNWRVRVRPEDVVRQLGEMP